MTSPFFVPRKVLGTHLWSLEVAGSRCPPEGPPPVDILWPSKIWVLLQRQRPSRWKLSVGGVQGWKQGEWQELVGNIGLLNIYHISIYVNKFLYVKICNDIYSLTLKPYYYALYWHVSYDIFIYAQYVTHNFNLFNVKKKTHVFFCDFDLDTMWKASHGDSKKCWYQDVLNILGKIKWWYLYICSTTLLIAIGTNMIQHVQTCTNKIFKKKNNLTDSS